MINEGGPTKKTSEFVIYFTIDFKKLLDIDLLKHTFSIEFQLEAGWKPNDINLLREEDTFKYDEKVTKENEAKNNNSDRIYFTNGESTFNPRLKLDNLLEYIDTQNKSEWYTVDSVKGHIFWKIHMKGKFQHYMNLRLFPVDTQNLNVAVICQNHNDSALKYILIENMRVRSNIPNTSMLSSCSNDYEFIEKVQFKTSFATSASKNNYSVIQIGMSMKRDMAFWQWNVLLPIAVLGSISFTMFAIEPKDFGSRINIIFTTILCILSYKFILISRLPNTSYFTLIDHYILAALLHQVSLIVYSCFAGIDALENFNLEYEEHYPRKTIIYCYLVWFILHSLFWYTLRQIQRGTTKPCVQKYLWVRKLRKEVSSPYVHSLCPTDLFEAYNTAKEALNAALRSEEGNVSYSTKIRKQISSNNLFIGRKKLSPNSFEDICPWEFADADKLYKFRLSQKYETGWHFSSSSEEPFDIITFKGTDDAEAERSALEFRDTMVNYFDLQASEKGKKQKLDKYFFYEDKNQKATIPQIEVLSADWFWIVKRDEIYDEFWRNESSIGPTI